jgi:hypothetical protein
LQEDPLDYAVAPCLYEYAGNSPISNRDPTGMGGWPLGLGSPGDGLTPGVTFTAGTAAFNRAYHDLVEAVRQLQAKGERCIYGKAWVDVAVEKSFVIVAGQQHASRLATRVLDWADKNWSGHHVIINKPDPPRGAVECLVETWQPHAFSYTVSATIRGLSFTVQVDIQATVVFDLYNDSLCWKWGDCGFGDTTLPLGGGAGAEAVERMHVRSGIAPAAAHEPTYGLLWSVRATSVESLPSY